MKIGDELTLKGKVVGGTGTQVFVQLETGDRVALTERNFGSYEPFEPPSVRRVTTTQVVAPAETTAMAAPNDRPKHPNRRPTRVA